MTPLPHEPVSYAWLVGRWWADNPAQWDCDWNKLRFPLRVRLANEQLVIVKPRAAK